MGPTCYLENILIDRAATKPQLTRWFGFDHFAGAPRLVGWILATKNIKHTLSQLGPEFGEPVRLRINGPFLLVRLANFRLVAMAQH